MNEFELLKKIILRHYNLQYNTVYNPIDFDIVSIPAAVRFSYGYQLSSKTTVDYLRIRVYLIEGDYDFFNQFRIEVNYPISTDALGDEVYVATGTIDKYYKDSGAIKYLKVNTRDKNYILLENGQPMLLENGSPFLLE